MIDKTASLISPTWGTPLNEDDYATLQASWITRELADQALLRRVTNLDGAALVGRKAVGDYAGIIFPYIWPSESHVREYRLRRDRPEIEYDADGTAKEKNKYLTPPGRGNLLYFVPGTQPDWLDDASLPIAITEGEKKTIALYRLARHGLDHDGDQPRFLPMGLSGVWNWRGTVGKTTGPDGDRRDVKGPIPDLDRITWKDRCVYIVFDANVNTNSKVATARTALTAELGRRGAEVLWVDLPREAGERR